MKNTYYSKKNSELKLTLLLVNIIVNIECQHCQNSAAGLYHVLIFVHYCTGTDMHFVRCEIFDVKQWNINEIMKPALCIQLICNSPLVHFFFLAPFRLPITFIRPS